MKHKQCFSLIGLISITKYFFQQKLLTADVRVSSNSLDTTAVTHSYNYDSHLICFTFLGRFCIFSTCQFPR